MHKQRHRRHPTPKLILYNVKIVPTHLCIIYVRIIIKLYYSYQLNIYYIVYNIHFHIYGYNHVHINIYIVYI